MSDPTADTRPQESENPSAEAEANVEAAASDVEAQAAEADAAVTDAAVTPDSADSKATETSPAEAAAEEPAAEAAPEEPAAEAAAEEPAAEAAPEEQAAETADEEPAAEAAPEEPANEAAAEEPAAEAAPEEPAAEAAAEEPAAEAAPEEPAAEAAAEEPAAEAAPEEQAAEEPAAVEAATEATTEEPAAEEPAEATPEKPAEAKAGDDETKAEAKDETAKAHDAEQDAELQKLAAAMEAKEPVDGRVIGWNKGGYHVAMGKIAAFCPVSQIEIGNPRSPKRYLDKTFPFRVIEIQKGGRRVVVSRAAQLDADRKARAAKVREKLEVGAELEGRVSSVTDFGAFVDLGGGIEGLVHVSEISRQRVEHAKEKVQPGQTVKVAVIKIEKGGKRISLSMKRLEDDPWDGVKERFTPGQEFTGKIARKTDFGLFVEVEPGLEGLVHVSRLPLGSTLQSDALAEGNEIQGWVHEVDRKRRRLSLSLRPVAEGNPWKDVQDKYPEGELVEGTVERLAKFGVFIELEPGLTGLLPFAVLGAVSNPGRQFQIGKPVKVKVLSVDRDKRRISLGTEASKAEGSQQDYREYVKTQEQGSSGGMNALAAALAKVKGQISTPSS